MINVIPTSRQCPDSLDHQRGVGAAFAVGNFGRVVKSLVGRAELLCRFTSGETFSIVPAPSSRIPFAVPESVGCRTWPMYYRKVVSQ